MTIVTKKWGRTHNKLRISGFTIVELLIVIVIIAILAALVIVAYNGIQQKSRNASRIDSAKAIKKIIRTYMSQEGKYPYTSNACIGSNYTDWDGDGRLDCYQSNSVYHPVTAMDNELLKVVKKIPDVEVGDVKANSGGFTFRGFLYNPGWTIDGQTGRVVIRYWLEGTNQDCKVPGEVSLVGGVYVINGAKNYSGNYYGTTYCIVAIAAL
jgi:prepilin-type N-terminal cleavage/methylation domain-containing protein